MFNFFAIDFQDYKDFFDITLFFKILTKVKIMTRFSTTIKLKIPIFLLHFVAHFRHTFEDYFDKD